MIFDFVTITGADDNVDLLFLDDMMTKYSHVEWGILLSQTRKGTPRYPSEEWLSRLAGSFYTKFDTHFSAHICGSMCTRLIEGGSDLYTSGELVPRVPSSMFRRIQLNSFPEMSDRVDLIDNLTSGLGERGIGIVLPIPNDAVLQNCQRLSAGPSFLYDASRGTGTAPLNQWPEPAVSGYVGFAGGIIPDNIKAVLDTLCSQPDNRHFWLDLETGARTDDKFDMKKVEKILRIAEDYVG